MRIAFVGARGVPALYSGFETAVTEIGLRLAERGHDVTVYCRKGYGDESEPTYLGIKKKYLPRINLKIADTLSHTFFSLVHLFFHPTDVLVVVNSANGPLCILPRLRGTPFAVNVDGIEWIRGKWSGIGQKYFYFASWFCTKIATAILADSRGIQDFYAKTWNARSYYAAYGAYLEKSSKPQLLEEFDLEKNGYFLVVARLEPENNAALIVKAFQGVKTDKRLVIIGGSNFKSGYVRNLKEGTKDERVRFLDGVYCQERLTELICNSFSYIHGHMVGGTNPVLLKALGCGACVLYADVNFNTEVVGQAGLPFPLDVDGARSAFQDLVDNPDIADRYREAGPNRIEEGGYTWDLVTDRYEELCERLYRGDSPYDDS